ncbi:MAG: hypothetical protein PUC65_05025 [Clostridiales bacterium]|nr:hypothetical protein [Clostridiales bacterium]
MPHINRIRVNNVKYNFGTQAYDDFIMKPFCHNTLYDLANGGGKSVLMLLMLQNVLPNCTLDEKQPVEKLFRTGDGSQTIHSLIEWRLDDADVVNGYRFMTTGFCAKKAAQKDSEEEKVKESASIEYFNYCIFYRDYNENDIRNLPLVKDKERITYSGLKKYLKELERDNSLIVRVFDVKREYQAFISKYGLYESEWEIIRGINKTEGHVRTYFETNYKTTRKVVEDLLIEEIIQKSIQLKSTVGEEESMSKTLLDIREKLMELSKRKREISNYDKQMELLNGFSSRLEALLHVYQELEGCERDLAHAYALAKQSQRLTNEKYDQQSAEIEELKESVLTYKKKLEQSKVYKNECSKKAVQAEIEELSKEFDKISREREELSTSLHQKECMNEYLEYLQEKQKRNEATESLRAIQNKNAGMNDEISAYVSFVKEYYESLTKQLTNQMDELKKTQAELSKQLEHVEERGLNMERELAVAQNLYETAQSNNQAAQKLLAVKKSEVGILLSEEVPQAIRENETTMRKLAADLEASANKSRELVERESNTRIDGEKLKFEITQLEHRKEEEQAFLDQYAKDKKKVEQLLAAYGKSDHKTLIEEIHTRLKKAIQQVANLRQEQKLYQEELLRLERGDFALDDTLLNQAKDYLISRYQVQAVTGVEYINQLAFEKRRDLLSIVSFLPYSVVITSGYERCYENIKFYGKEFDNVVIPVINGASLEHSASFLAKEELLLVSKDQSLLYDEKRLINEKDRLRKEISDLTVKIHRLEEQEITYSEDEAYIHVFMTTTFKKYQEIVEQNQVTLQSIGQCKEQEKQLTQQLKDLSRELSELKDSVAWMESELTSQKLKSNILKDLVELVEKVDHLGREEDAYSQKAQRLLAELERVNEEKKKLEATFDTIRTQEESKSAKLSEIVTLWDTKYKMFYVEGTYQKPNLTIEEIFEKLNGYLQAIQSKYTDLEDKNRLINSYVQAMNRCLKSIESKGMSIARLEELRMQDALVETKEDELIRLTSQLERSKEEYTRCEKELLEKKSVYSRYEGMIEQAISVYEQTYGTYISEPMESMEFSSFVKEAEQKIAATQRKEKQLSDGLNELLKAAASYESLAKDMERILRDSGVSLEESFSKEGQIVVLKELQSSYDQLEKQWYRYDKEKKAKLEEFAQNKQKTIQSFIALNASGLAQEIDANVHAPLSVKETMDLIHNFTEVNECLNLEKDRIVRSVQDMQDIKDNFENQCLQRCVHIKTELERLPKLSKIMLNNEQIPMISLSIPYIKEEFFKEKMSEYIDEIVNGTDAFTDYQERLKYIRNALSLKKLFSVIVTDMNAIKLSLYKRERIKEQSRHLRYEEAVGSTGQSQGIYTQFLIAIITYISNVNSRRMDNDGLRKVIFIDNPFGAAKDVYIWEPIFELLEQNKVQLIVPARGTTPAITSRFDVNYILGQKLINNRQQTVVVDYHSSVEARETEFTPLKYEQTSFDLYDAE